MVISVSAPNPDLVPVLGISVGVGRSDHDGRRLLGRDGLDGCHCRVCSGQGCVARTAGCELVNLDIAQTERRQPSVNRVGQVVRIDVIVLLIRDEDRPHRSTRSREDRCCPP